MTPTTQPTVLIVEDEQSLADLYADRLNDVYAVRIAYDGNEALDQLDTDVDIVLLDRRLPGLSGDEVLDRIRERELDCQVAMVTAIEPDFDIIELGFDEYLTKPVLQGELTDLVERLLARATYDQSLQESYRLAAKKAALEAEKSRTELEASEEYAALRRRLAELDETLTETHTDLENDDIAAVFRSISDSIP